MEEDTLLRPIVVIGLSPLNNRLSKAEPVDLPYQTVMFWGGLRGTIPIALVLGLPADFEHRVLLLDLSLGVVLFSLLVQGTTKKETQLRLFFLSLKPG